MTERGEFICPREGNHCSSCELLARNEFIETFDYYSEGGNSPEKLKLLADDAKLRAKLEENTKELSCDNRQRLALMIGNEAGRRMGIAHAARKHGLKMDEDQDDE